jgi:DHA1 family bicyclomycin/chloramphenicol resistance-like MFS transporter
MGSTTAVAPALAPVVGGALLVAFGWPSIFLFLAIYAALTLAVVGVGLPESLPRERRQTLHPRTVMDNYLSAISNRTFLAHALAVSLMFAGHYGFMSGAPFVLIELFEVPEAHFGWYFLFVVAAFIAGNLLGARLISKVGGHRLILVGGSLLVLAGVLVVSLVASGADTLAAIIGPQVIYAIGSGMMMPQLIAGALAPFRHMAGTAASMLGFIQMGSAAASSALVGRLYDGTALPMVLVIALAGASALVVYLSLSRRPVMDVAR